MRKGGSNPYTEEERLKICDEICDRMVKGETLSDILEDEHMPSRSAFSLWREQNKVLMDKYDRARAEQELAFCDKILKVSEDFTITDNQRRIKIDALKWTSSRIRGGAKGAPTKEEPVTAEALELALSEIVEQLKGAK